tara:strand:+ start:9681 stop:11162 length:1482 start_codon:yes stop_codon:yes gene_type:complete
MAINGNNAFELMAQAHKLKGEAWHDDFFASMANKGYAEPGFWWKPGDTTLSYKPVTSQNNTVEWDTYARAAKSRGVRPDYKRFQETMNALKANKNSKMLDGLGQLVTLYANNKDFQKAYKATLRTNPKLRGDIMKSLRTNIDHPMASTLMTSLQDIAADPKSVLGTSVMEGLVDDRVNPLVPFGTAQARAGIKGLTGGRAAYMAQKAAGKGVVAGVRSAAAHAMLPGWSTIQHARGMAGRGAMAPHYANKGWSATGAFRPGAPLPMKQVGWANAINQKGTIRNDLFKSTRSVGNDLTKIGGKNAFNIKGKELNWRSAKDKKAWINSVNRKLNKGIKQVKGINFGKKGQLYKDKYLKELNKTKKEISKLAKSKTVTKKAMQSVVNKGLVQNSGQIINRAVAKVGWTGILRRAGLKLGSKIVASGLLKSATPFTAGISGAVSLGMDAWLVHDLYTLSQEILKEYGEAEATQAQIGTSPNQNLELDAIVDRKKASF